MRIRQSGNNIRSSRAACNEADADFSGCLRIAFRFKDQSLFMPWQDDLDILLFIQFIKDIRNHSARISKYRIHAFFPQRFYK